MTTKLYLKYGGATKSNITNFEVVLQYKGIDSATFNILGYYGVNLSTWKGYSDGDLIQIYRSDTDALVYSGYVTEVYDTDPITIVTMGIFSRMQWDILENQQTKFVKNTVYVDEAPTDANLHVVDIEGNDPGLSNNQYNGVGNPDYYMVISDDTQEENSVTLHATANSVIVLGNVDDNDASETEIADNTYWGIDSDTHTGIRVCCHLDMEDEAIAKTAQITKIVVKYAFQITCANLDEPLGIYIAWDKNQAGSYQGRHIGAYSFPPEALDEYRYYEIDDIVVEDNGNWFNDGAANLEDGAITFEVFTNGAATNVDLDLDLDFLEVIVYYSTATFEEINRKVNDTQNHAGGTYDILIADNGGAPYDLNGKGLATDDKVTICLGVQNAFELCQVEDFTMVINNGDDPLKGVPNDYELLNKYQLWKILCDMMGYVYFTDYSDNWKGRSVALKEEDIDAATVTYSTASDPPETFPNGQFKNTGEYGYVVVKYKYGTTGRIYADTPSTNKKGLPIKAPDILTLTKARELGKTMANYYATNRPNIPLVWNYLPTNLPQPGYKYNYTRTYWNGAAFTTETYTDLICTQVKITQNGGEGAFKIEASLGGNNTPADEELMLVISEIERREDLRDAVITTNAYTQYDHTIASHIDTNASGANLNTLVGGGNVGDLHYHDGRYYTETETNAHLMIGSANAAWIPITLIGYDPSDFTYYTSKIYNAKTANRNLDGVIELPTNRGSLKLYIDDVKIEVVDGDATDYINSVQRYGDDTLIDTNNDNCGAGGAETKTYAFDAADVSSYARASIVLNCVDDTAAKLQIVSVVVKCYYDS